MNNDDQYTPTEEQVRAWCREGTGDYPDVMDEWLDRFLARVRRDAARQAEAERDEWQEASAKLAASSNQANADLYEAEARIRAVRAIHRDLYESMSGVPYCDECDRAWPCPTIRALDGDAWPPTTLRLASCTSTSSPATSKRYAMRLRQACEAP